MRKTLKRNLSYDDRNHLYYVSLYYDGENGRRVRRTRTYPTMEQAEQVIAEYRRAQLLGGRSAPEGVFMEDWLRYWMDELIKPNCEETTCHGYENILNTHMIPSLGRLYVQDLTPVRVQQYYGELRKKGLANNTIRKHHVLLHAALGAAVRQGIVGANVTCLVTPPAREAPQHRFYDSSQLRMLFCASEGTPLEVAVKLAGCLGLRAGIPVSVGGGDGACANIGAGVAKPGDFYLSLGTTAWIAGQMEEPFIDPQHRVFHIYTLDGHGCNVFGTEQCAGRSVSWAMELFDVASARAFDSAAATVPAGAGGLIYLPYLEGERSPVFDAQAQGVFFGMNTTHKREHFLRAVLEGTACGLSQILDVMRERQEIHDLRIIGGGAKSKLWKQILADVCNVTLHDVSTFSDSATSLGAAAAAGVAIGLFKNLPEACSHIRMSGDIEPDPAVQPVYALIKKRYAMLYPSLKEAFHTRA